jgi:hypothetical protein
MIIPIRQQMDDLEKKIAEMEQSITLIAQHVKESSAPQNVDDLHKIHSKIIELEKSTKVIAQYVKAELENFRMGIKDAPIQAGSIDTEKIHELEKKLQDKIYRVEELIESSNKSISQDVESRINSHIQKSRASLEDGDLDQISKTKASLERYVNVKMQLLENRITELSGFVKDLRAQKQQINSDEKICDLEKRLTSDIDEIRKYLESSTQKGASSPGFEALEIESIRKEIAHLRSEILHSKKAGSDIGHEDLRSEMHSIARQYAAKPDVSGSEDVSDLRKELRELRQMVEGESAIRSAQSKNISDIEHSVRSFNVRDEIDSLRASVEKETVSRLSIEKNLSDMEDNLSKLKDRFGPIAKLDDMDFDTLRKEIGEFREFLDHSEKEMHLKAMDLITKQLHEFAKSLDKRIPDLVTKEEFEHSLADIKQRMQNVNAPDLRPLARRIEQLESDLSGIASLMHAVYNRVPIIVE